MSAESNVTNIRFTPASANEQRTGLLGWTSCVVDHRWAFDRIAVRRTRQGRLALSFPSKSSRNGGRNFYFRPIDDDSRRAIEHAIFTSIPLAAGPHGEA